jgi:chromate reductase
MTKKILFVVGSTRKGSFNGLVAEEAAKFLAGKAEVTYLEYMDLPFMNQDLEFPAPDVVTRVRETVKAADGIWVFSPEYNYSYPGIVKNLFDWLSRPMVKGDYATAAATGKKITVSNIAGKSTGAGSRAKLVELFGKIRMIVMDQPLTGLAIPPAAFGGAPLTFTDEQKAQLKTQAEAFLKFIE